MPRGDESPTLRGAPREPEPGGPARGRSEADRHTSGQADQRGPTSSATAARFPIGRSLLMPWIGRGRRLECGLLVLVAAGLLACDMSELDPRLRGSGVEGTDRRSVEPFDAVSVGADFDVSIEVGPETSVTLSGDDNLLPIVRTEVTDGTLRIEATRLYDSRRGIRVKLTTPSLRAVAVSGSSNVEARRFRASRFRASVSGSGSLLAEGDADRLDLSVTGSGDLMLKGSADRVAAAVSGSGDLHLLELRARTADVSVTGSGSATLLASEQLNASVSGTGEVRYGGTPRVTRRVTGSGSVRPLGPESSELERPLRRA